MGISWAILGVVRPDRGKDQEERVPRIKKTPAELKLQLEMAAAAATALGLTWPMSAPTPAQMTAAANDLGNSITSLAALKADVSIASDLKDVRMGTSDGYMVRVDEVTDFLYTPAGSQKLDFGLTPKGLGTQEPLHKLIVIVLEDGPLPGSLKFDWESIEGATYEVQWSSTSNFSVIVGSAVSASTSDYIISGLVPGTQYWTRVRPLRGGGTEQWSDPATRVAPV